ncbi:hypothetical protein GCM10009592_14520 [Brachybacterium rhamnosum]|uniref:Tetratrico peptide repeat group 5 domain-containing protein n=1 Tax=Brachybacterium rhamnosum TaxID=173361 RepID=A0ABW4PW32_9MICO
MSLLDRLRRRTTPTPPAPLTVEERGRQHHDEIRTMLREQAASSPIQAAHIAAGSVDGTHYLELLEPIKQAKREGRLDDALALAYQAIQGAEGDRGAYGPAPAYTEHAAIILRKLGRLDEEAAVLDRYLAWLTPEQRTGHRLEERRAKVRALQAAA